MKLVVALSGPIAVGKSSFSAAFSERFSTKRISTRKYIIAQTSAKEERAELQAAGDELDAKTGGALT